MKKSETLNIFTGILLVMLAAFFSISLLVQFLNFGNSMAGTAKFLCMLGTMLVSVYGFCSILIPVFLMVAAAFAFSAGWTVKNGTSLLLSFFPFFTAVLTERICRMMAGYESGPLLNIKILCTIFIGILIIIIEYLFFGILGQHLSLRIFSSGKKNVQMPPVKREVEPEVIEKAAMQETPAAEYAGTIPEAKTSSVFDHVFDAVPAVPVTKNAAAPGTAVAPVPAEPQIVPAADSEVAPEAVVAPVAAPEALAAPVADIAAAPVMESAAVKSEEPHDVTSLITEEEFNALTHPIAESRTLDPDFFDVDINQEDDADEESPEAKTSDFRGISDVFAEMDNDARQQLENENDILNEDESESDENAELIPDFPARMADSSTEEPDKETSEPEEQDETEDYEVNDSEMPDFEQTEQDSSIAAEEVPAYQEEEECENQALPMPEEIKNLPVQEETSVPPAPARKKFRGEYKIPVEKLLTEYADDPYWVIDDETKKASVQLKETLSEFKIDADIIGIRKGPVVTMFEMLPAPGVKLSKIAALQDNIALRLAASSVRIVAPIPGKQAVGIEVPNKNRSIVSFREIIERDLPEFKKMAVPVILGKDIEGEPQIIDLVKTPHLLIAGATGSGKSVCVNSMILSILYKRSPQQVKLILIDPKIVELKLYNDIPHLLTPVITEAKKAFQALQYCLCEMERRYALLDSMGVRDISSYNKRIVERHIATEKLPYIVVIIDEFADLMATTGKELESTVARLAAMSRAIGIHIVLATQRPSIDVITGLIKANIPTRIAFMVASKMDSRIIIDQVGAEKLLGRGDMLYASAVDPFPIRIQGTFVSDNEVENVVDYVKQYGPPDYIDDEIFVDDDEDEEAGPSLFDDGEDPLYEKALDIVVQAGKASASYIQRRLKIGYNRAARLVEEMESRGIVGPQNGSKPREIIHIP